MTFANPLFLSLLPAIAAPIIFHLMMKRKSKVHEFPSFMFFLRADPRMHSRRRLKEIILLALRMLAILFVVLALSRPSWQYGSLFFDDKVAVVVLIDNSGSMTGPADDRRTKLSVAVDAAERLVESLDKDTEAGVVLLVDDPAADVPRGMTVNKKELLEALQRIKPTEAAGMPGLALSNALDYRRDGSGNRNSGFAIHVFSDLQTHEWDRTAMHLDEDDRQATITIHRIPSQEVRAGNVAIAEVKLPPGRILPNHPCSVRVILRNDAAETSEVRLSSQNSLQQNSTQTVRLEPSGSEAIDIEFSPESPGQYWMRFWIEGDSLVADNHAAVGFDCAASVTVLLVGEPAQFGLFSRVVSPAGDGRFTSMIPEYVTTANFATAVVEHEPIMVVATWGSLSEATYSEALRAYAEAGGNVFVVPEVEKPPATTGPAWLGADALDLVTREKEGPIEILDRRSAVWGPLRTDAGKTAVRYVPASRFQPLRLSSDYRVLMGPSYLEPVLGHRKVGKGGAFVSGLPMSRSWSSLATDPSGISLVLVQHAALGTQDGPSDHKLSLIAGERPPPLPIKEAQVRVTSLVGDFRDDLASPSQLPAFPRSGVYRIDGGPDGQWTLSVRSADKEGLPGIVTAEQVPLLQGIDHAIYDFTGAEDYAAQLKSSVHGSSLFLPLLLLALAALMAESWRGSAGAKGGKQATVAVAATTAIPQRSPAKEIREAA